MSRILILPSGNTFSHLRECQLIGADLARKSHDVHFGISKHYQSWAEQEGISYSIIPELWERGPTDHPNVSWFIDHNYLATCVQAELELIKTYSPDLILADFKYTTGISARVCSIPLITKNILTMLPETKANFGFLQHDQSAASQEQSKFLHFFDHFACTALNKTASRFGSKPFQHMADFLTGDWVLLPDSPWFQQVETIPANHLPVTILQQSRRMPNNQALHVWNNCPGTERAVPPNEIKLPPKKANKSDQDDLRRKKVFLALGSVCRTTDVLVHLASALSQGDWQLFISLSGDNSRLQSLLNEAAPKAQVASFYDVNKLAAEGLDLYVSQGGLGSIYSGMEHGIPMLIVPLQPEQDHNGLLVEHHGIGKRLFPSRAYSGQEDLYIQTILDTPKTVISEKACQILFDPAMQTRNNEARKKLTEEMSNRPTASQALQNILVQDNKQSTTVI